MADMHDHKHCTYCNKELKEWQKAAGKKYCDRGCSAAYLVLRNKARTKGKLRSDQMKAMRKKYGHNYHKYLPGLNELSPGWIPEYSEDGWDWTDSKGKEHVIVVDIAHPRHRLAIEFDGPDHTHEWKWQRSFDPARDNERDKLLKKKRWTVIRIPQWPTVADLLSTTANFLLKKRALNISDDELTYELASPSPERTLSINTHVSREELMQELTANTKIAIQWYDRTIRQIGKTHRPTMFWNGVPTPTGDAMLQRLYHTNVPLKHITVGGLAVVLDSGGQRVFFSGPKYATDASPHPKIIRNESDWRRVVSELRLKSPYTVHHFPRKKVMLAQGSFRARMYKPLVRIMHKLTTRFIRDLEAELDYSIEIPRMRLTRDSGEFDIRMRLRTEAARRLLEISLKSTSLGRHQLEVSFWNRVIHYKEFQSNLDQFERHLGKELGWAYAKILPKLQRRIEQAKDEGPRNIQPKWIGEKLKLYKGFVGDDMTRNAAFKLELAAAKLDANHNYELAMKCRWAAVRIEAQGYFGFAWKYMETFASESLAFIVKRYSVRLGLAFVGIYYEAYLDKQKEYDDNAAFTLPPDVKATALEGLDPEKDDPPPGITREEMKQYFEAKKMPADRKEELRSSSMSQAFSRTTLSRDIDEIFRRTVLRPATRTGSTQTKEALSIPLITPLLAWIMNYFKKLVWSALSKVALRLMGKKLDKEEKKSKGKPLSRKTVENVVADSIEKSFNSIDLKKMKKDLRKVVKKYKLEIPKNISVRDVQRITDQEYLIQIAMNYPDTKVRKAAISKLSDMPTLRKLYMYDKDRKVRDAAYERYRELAAK